MGPGLPKDAKCNQKSYRNLLYGVPVHKITMLFTRCLQTLTSLHPLLLWLLFGLGGKGRDFALQGLAVLTLGFLVA